MYIQQFSISIKRLAYELACFPLFSIISLSTPYLSVMRKNIAIQ